MAQVDDELKDLYRLILDNGEQRDTRTGSVKSVWDGKLTFDLSEEFPAVTSKRLAWKATVGELLFFCKGVSDRRVLQEYTYGLYEESKWDIWKQDCDRQANKDPIRFNGFNLGDMYPVMWRSIFSPSWEKVSIKKRHDIDYDYKEKYFDLQESMESDDPVVGGVFESKKSGKFRVIRKSKIKYRYVVQFLDTGYIPNTRPTLTTIKKGYIKDIFCKSIAGIGYLGEMNAGTDREYLLWSSMIKRCYDNNDQNYSRYGGNGVYVSPRWHNYSNFVKDIKSLPNYMQWSKDQNGWCLDKDYYSGDVYSRNTCVFIPKSINSKLVGHMIEKDGVLYSSISDFERSLGLTPKGKKRNVLKNGGCYVEDNGDTLTRPKIFKDQLSDLIDSLKNRPHARDHILMNWNPRWENDCVLPACHLYAQFYVTNSGVLNCSFSMRSSDAFLGLPMNIASYALLTHLLAKWTGLRVGKLSCDLGDVHLYDNHKQAVDTFLNNPKFKPCQLQLPEGTETLESTLNLTALDFEKSLIGYESMGVVKAPLSVGK